MDAYLVPVGAVGVGGPAYKLGLLDGNEALAALKRGERDSLRTKGPGGGCPASPSCRGGGRGVTPEPIVWPVVVTQGLGWGHHTVFTRETCMFSQTA